jgi:hypothetical protein
MSGLSEQASRRVLPLRPVARARLAKSKTDAERRVCVYRNGRPVASLPSIRCRDIEFAPIHVLAHGDERKQPIALASSGIIQPPGLRNRESERLDGTAKFGFARGTIQVQNDDTDLQLQLAR